VARTSITPVVLNSDNAVSNLTSLLTTAGNSKALVPGSGAGNGIVFTNIPGQIFLGISLGSTASTATVQVGMNSLPGLSATTYTVTIPTSAISWFAGFHSVVNQPGSLQVQIDFSSVTNLVVALFQQPLVY
jgi:hypothetical protein